MFTRRAFVTRTAAMVSACYFTPRCYAEGSDKTVENGNNTQLGNSEKILFNSLRLFDATANISGTGFIFSLFRGQKLSLMVIVTNKHVVESMKSCTLLFHKSLAEGRPDYLGTLPVTITDIATRWIGHNTQDLAIIPIGYVINDLVSKGTTPFIVTMTPENVPNNEELNTLNPVEEVLTVGYPSGLSDTLHNLPLFHSGHTATPPFLPFPTTSSDPEHGGILYQSDKAFMVDFTTWFGSSGSPVFLNNSLGFIDRSGTMHPLEQRLRLLGVVEGLVSMPVPGTITLSVVPNIIKGTQTVNIPANLGLCLSSSSILDFENIFIDHGFKVDWEYTSARK